MAVREKRKEDARRASHGDHFISITGESMTAKQNEE